MIARLSSPIAAMKRPHIWTKNLLISLSQTLLPHEHVDIVLTQAARLGARASLQKPFNPGELMLLAHDVWAQRDDALLLAA